MTREEMQPVSETFRRFVLCCGRHATRQSASLRLSASLITFPGAAALPYDGCFARNMVPDLLDLNEMDFFSLVDRF